eukprot:TRINITY_DN49578_c0_g1_i1.p1 TRINITY_DN49578_c0_g1~~TRINITY_DN49578_c0_g1_i1.p1  ORF type:complete len:330 (-),score=44.58 TRINITY_DN49578_c0_g1_i1:583-1491(-)
MSLVIAHRECFARGHRLHRIIRRLSYQFRRLQNRAIPACILELAREASFLEAHDSLQVVCAKAPSQHRNFFDCFANLAARIGNGAATTCKTDRLATKDAQSEKEPATTPVAIGAGDPHNDHGDTGPFFLATRGLPGKKPLEGHSTTATEEPADGLVELQVPLRAALGDSCVEGGALATSSLLSRPRGFFGASFSTSQRTRVGAVMSMRSTPPQSPLTETTPRRSILVVILSLNMTRLWLSRKTEVCLCPSLRTKEPKQRGCISLSGVSPTWPTIGYLPGKWLRSVAGAQKHRPGGVGRRVSG